MTDKFINIKNLSKRYDDIAALQSVNIEVGADELLVILGPTGAGKTTLLRSIVGLETPDAGQILMDGKDISQFSPAQRDFSLVFQNFSLYPKWTVYDNLAFPLKAPGRKMTKKEIHDKIQWAANILQIETLLKRRTVDLSGGEMQRVAIGKSIVRTPRLFLMDEPFSNLDLKLRQKLRVELVDIRRRLCKPMIYVTHDQEEALSMADRIVILAEGKVLQIGTPKEIYETPNSAMVAKQIGKPQINLLTVIYQNGAWYDEQDNRICDANNLNQKPGFLGVRPENINVRGGDYEGRITFVEDMGPTQVLYVDWLNYNIKIITHKENKLWQAGERISPRLNPNNILYFKS